MAFLPLSTLSIRGVFFFAWGKAFALTIIFALGKIKR